jgi:hypothetical protein
MFTHKKEIKTNISVRDVEFSSVTLCERAEKSTSFLFLIKTLKITQQTHANTISIPENVMTFQ